MRLINANAVWERYNEEYRQQDICDGADDKDWLERCINEAEIIDAEPVVRCKHCKHRGFSECTMYHEEWYDYDDDGYLESDIRVYDYTEDDGFCHKGEREGDFI